MDGRFDPCFVYSWFKVLWEPSHARGNCSGSCLKIYPFMGEFSTESYQTCVSIKHSGIITFLKKEYGYIDIEVLLKDSTVEQLRG